MATTETDLPRTPTKERRKRFGRAHRSPKKLAYDIVNTSPKSKSKLRSKLFHRREQRTKDDLNKAATVFGFFEVYDDRCHTPTPAFYRKPIAIDSSTADILALLQEPLLPDGSKHVMWEAALEEMQAISAAKHAGKQRSPSNCVAMSKNSKRISPNKYAKKYGFGHERDGAKWEWTHLIGYRFIGDKAQVPHNMVLATKECNTLMMFIEDEVAKLITEGYDVVISADTLPSRYPVPHTADKIIYNVWVDSVLDLTLEFDPFSRYIPQQNLEDVAKALFECAMHKGSSLTCIPKGHLEADDENALPVDFSLADDNTNTPEAAAAQFASIFKPMQPDPNTLSDIEIVRRQLTFNDTEDMDCDEDPADHAGPSGH